MARHVPAILLLLVLASCRQTIPLKPVQLIGEAQGTYYAITYYDPGHRDLQFEIDSLLKAVDRSVSLWVGESIISRVNRNDPEATPDRIFMDNLQMSLTVAEKTGGAFDPTVGSLVRAWGFGFDASRNVDQQIIDSILAFTGYEKVTLAGDRLVKEDERTTLDFNAIAQGYSVDLIGTFLESKGLSNYLIDIGGEVKARGTKPDGTLWKVGIEKPAQGKNDSRTLKAVVELENQSIATSGNYRRFYEENGVRYSHTIDPATGYPVTHSLLSVSVVAGTTALADAYATAFMVMGLDSTKRFLSTHPELEAFFIYSGKEGTYDTYATAGFQKMMTRSFQ